jgi:DNA modification methylase
MLRELPDESVHMCVTSPPFFGLRDYGTGAWDGGDPDCDHKKDAVKNRGEEFRRRGEERGYAKGSNFANYGDRNATASDFENVCGKCGARRVDQQIGLEASPDQWVASLVAVFREVHRVLRRDGVLFVEVGDSYAASGEKRHGGWDGNNKNGDGTPRTSRVAGEFGGRIDLAAANVKPKDLVGAPWLLAFALRADGWYLRSDIIWARPNPMPESVTDRPTKSHSYVFLLAKQPRYFFDADAIREPASEDGIARESRARLSAYDAPGQTPQRRSPSNGEWTTAGRNKRSVWTIATQPLPDQHYAAYPEALVEPCILAGTSERGVCPACGAPWVRETERTTMQIPERAQSNRVGSEATPMVNDGARRRAMNGQEWAKTASVKTTGWRPTCECPCTNCGLQYVHDTDVPGMPNGSESSKEAAAVLQPDVFEPLERSSTAAQDEDIEGLYRGTRSEPSGSIEAGIRDGASPRGGDDAWPVSDLGRGSASLERDQGRQPARESRGDGEAHAQPNSEETSAGSRVSGVRGEDRSAGRELRRCRCDGGPPVRPAVILDPFLGSGTTALVARRLGRKCVGIELSEDYCRLIARRTQQLSLLGDAV